MLLINVDRLLKLARLLVAISGAASALSCVGVSQSPALQCPQPRFTGQAPGVIYSRENPFAHSAELTQAGRNLYEDSAGPACYACHGRSGDGRGPLAAQFDPPPRNFSCAKTVNGIPDGQLFWIIQNGSPGTNMSAFEHLSDEEIWQLVAYIRQLAQRIN